MLPSTNSNHVDEINPLLLSPVTLLYGTKPNFQVLETLFEKCDFDTLKAARQVCRTWQYVSISSFGRKSLVNFFNMYPDTYREILDHIPKTQLFDPINVALTLSPYNEVEPIDGHDRRISICPWTVCEEFIIPYGDCIKSLKFYAWDTTSDRLNGPLFSQVLRIPHHLQALEISLLPRVILLLPLFPLPWTKPPLVHVTSLTMYGKLECTQDFLYNFLGAMPNVNSITVNCCSKHFLDLFTAAFHDIKLIKVCQLKLNFVQWFASSHITNIEKAKLGLTTLHIAQRTSLRHFKEYERLLHQLAPTLEDAKLTCCSRLQNHEQFISIPPMTNLKTLRLQCWGRLGFWNIHFINNLPHLEILVMERRGLFAPSRNPPAKWTCCCDENEIYSHKHLKSLSLPAMPLLFLHENSLTLILQKFIFLKKLSLSATDDCLMPIFQNCGKLEEFTIAEYSKITDDGITGLISGNLVRVNEKDVEIPFNLSVALGITTLKELRKLEIDGFWGKVTDFSIKHGLAHLKKLEYVMLRGCKITEWSIKALAKTQLTVVWHDALHTFEPEPVDIDEPVYYV